MISINVKQGYRLPLVEGTPGSWRVFGSFLVAAALGGAGCHPPAAQDEGIEEAASALVDTQREPAWAHCPNGGLIVTRGFDRNHDGRLEGTEVKSIEFVCVGRPDASSTP